MNTLINVLSGKKTYLTTATLLIVLFGRWQGWWTVPDEVYVSLLALGLAFLRSGMNATPPTAQPGESQPGTSQWRTSALILALAAAGTVTLSGCSTTKLADIASQLKDDPAIVSVKVSTIYGTAQLTRVGGQTNSVSVSPDGTITVNK